ncbi:OmpA family protein [Parvibaculum sp.]|uniref:OmpA family protein n=1 Tax=Parvibaculum sp. TaxID=2024848 RepID=UPI0034A01A52
MKRMMIITALGFTTAIGAALAAKTAVASDPLPMPRPAAEQVAAGTATGIETRMILVSAIDPAASRATGYGVDETTRITFPVYFADGRTGPSAEAQMALRALAEEITYRGLTNITVMPSAAAMSADYETQAAAERRAAAVATALMENGVPERWIAVQPGLASDV